MKQLIKTIRKYQAWVIVGILVVATGISFYNRLTKQTSPAANQTNTATSSPSPSPAPLIEPTATANPTDTTIIETPIRWADLDSSRQAVAFLDPVDQALREIDLKTGTVTTLGTLTEPVQAAVWSPNHRWLAIVTGEGEATTIATYDIQNSKLHRLDTGITALSFLSNDKIIYQYRDDQNNTLTTANLDGSNWKAIDTPTGPVDIVWAGQTALIQPFESDRVTRYNQSGRTIETYRVPADFRLPQSSWTDNGPTAVYWINNEGQLTIKLHKSDGQTETISTFDWNEELFSVLWDNSTGAIYIASDSGLTRLAATAKP